MQKKYLLHQLLGFLMLFTGSFISDAQVVDTTFNTGTGANNEIREVLQQTDGKILIGGLFTVYNGKTTNRIARLNSNGSLDTSFHVGTGANFNVYTLALQSDGKILVGGNFTYFNNVAVKRIVRLHSNGTLDTTFCVTRNASAHPLYAGANGSVLKIKQLPNGQIMAAGCFNYFDGSSTTRFARLNADGSVDTTFAASFSPFALSFAMQSDGKLIGCFQASKVFVRLNKDGSMDNTFNIGSGPNGSPYDIFVEDDDKILVGGGYTSFNGFPYKFLVRLNSNGSIDTTFRTGSGPTNSVFKIARSRSKKYYIGGVFRMYDSKTTNSLARLEKDGSLDLSFNQQGTGVDSSPWSLVEVAPEKVLLVGVFTTFDGTVANRIIQVSGKFPPLSTPVIIASNSLVFCQGDSVTLSAPAGFAQYKWSNGATSSSIKVKQSGSFVVQVKYATSDFSEASAPLTVQVNPLPNTPSITASRALIFCQGDSVVLSAPGGQVGYLWSNGATTSSITVKQSGSFTVIVRNGNGCESLISPVVKIQVNLLPAQPAIVVPSYLSICQGDSLQLSGPEGFSGYRWSNAAITSSIWVKETGNYSLQVISSGGCISAVSKPVSVLVKPVPAQPTISASSALTFCQGDSVVLSAPSSQAGYSWSNGDTTASIIVKKSGRFIVWVTNVNGCESLASAAVNVKVNSLPNRPTINPPSSLSFCQGDSVQLTGPLGFSGYRWSNGAITSSIWVKQAGSYMLQVLSTAGCISPSSLPVSVQTISLPTQPTITTNRPLQLCQGDSLVLSAPAGQSAYRWSTNATTESITVKQTGSYWVKIKANSSCESISSVPVSVTFFTNPLAPSINLLGTDTLVSGSPGKHYHWEKDGQPFGEDASRIKVVQSGQYRVQLLNEAGCASPFSSPFAYVITGVDPATNEEEPIIFPNPANLELHIQVDPRHTLSEVRLFDLLGQLCRQFDAKTSISPMSLEGLPSGLYLAQIRIGTKTITKKVVIQH